MEEEVMRAGKWICGSIVGFWGLLAPVQGPYPLCLYCHYRRLHNWKYC